VSQPSTKTQQADRRPQRLIFTQALRRAWWWTVPVGVYSASAMLKPYWPFTLVPDIPWGLDAAVSFAMGMLLAFRINRAYERWWEARKHWGTLVNISRNLAVKARQLVAPEPEDSRQATRLIVLFCRTLEDHLRDEYEPEQMRRDLADAPERVEHGPSYLSGRIYRLFDRWLRTGRLDGERLRVLDQEARMLLEVCGACERIKNTLPSLSWRYFTRQLIAVYLLVLPWGLFDDFGVWTIPLVMVIAYFVIGGECIASYVDEPFGYHEDHLDLDAICDGIEATVTEAGAAERAEVVGAGVGAPRPGSAVGERA